MRTIAFAVAPCVLVLTLTTAGTAGAQTGASVPAVGSAGAQTSGECTTGECASRDRAAGAAARQTQDVWNAAARLHQLKLRFVAALQQVTRSQAGLLGDEGPALLAGVAALRASLTEWDEGVAQFLAQTKRLASTPDLYVARGTVLLDRHRPAPALAELAEAGRMDQDRPDIPALRALAFRLAGQAADARRAFRLAADRAPESAVVVYGSAEMSVVLKDGPGTKRDLTRVSRLLERAAQQPRPGEPFERVSLLRQVAGVAPIFPTASYVDAYAALTAGDFEAAVVRFDAAARRDSLQSASRPAAGAVARAAAALRAGTPARASEALTSAGAEGTNDAEWHRVFARTLWAAGEPAAGIEHAQSAIQLNPGDERARLVLADVLLAAGRAEAAVTALEEAVRALPRSGALRYQLGTRYQADGRWPEARTAYEASAGLQPVVGQDALYAAIGAVAMNQADFAGAATAYAKRIDVNPNSVDAHRQLGEVYFLQGLDEEALAEHSVAAWLGPTSAASHAGRGHALARLQRHVEATVAFRQALAAGDDRPETHYGLATALTRAGKADEARPHIDASQRLRASLLERGQRDFRVDGLVRAAAAARAAGQTDDAITSLQEAVAADPAAPGARRALGLALLAGGRAAEAATHLAQAEADVPTVEGTEGLIRAFDAVGNTGASRAARAALTQLTTRAAEERVRLLTGAR